MKIGTQFFYTHSKTLWPIFLIIFITAVLIFAFQTCTGFNPQRNLASANLALLQPPTDKLDSECMSSPSYDTCIFKKNPVAQQDKTYGTSPTANDLLKQQIYGVKLTQLGPENPLENESIKVSSASGQAAPMGTSFKIAVNSDPDHLVDQLMAFYWLNRTIQYISPRTGLFYAQGKGIRVVVNDTLAGWSSVTNSIHLKSSDDGNHMAWNGDLLIYFLGLANIHYATQGKIIDYGSGSSNKHRICGNGIANGCCKTSQGCAKAIASGAADYLTAVMFPRQTALGETWSNNIDGVNVCGISRNVANNKQLTAESAFGACSDGAEDKEGEVHNLGSVYASIWWEVRTQVGDSESANIDRLYTNHLPLLNGQDDFSTAFSKIQSLDQKLFAGKYSSLFSSQFNQRGISLK